MRHELHLTAAGLRAGLVAALAAVVAGALVAGGRGAASAALGAGLVGANFVVAAFSTGWSRKITPGVVAVGYAGFVVRMFAVLAAFAVLAVQTWMQTAFFAGAFCLELVVFLAAACVSYARGSYVPDWRVAR